MIPRTEVLRRGHRSGGSAAVAKGIGKGLDARGGRVRRDNSRAHGIHRALHGQLAYVQARLLQTDDKAEMRGLFQKGQVQAPVFPTEHELGEGHAQIEEAQQGRGCLGKEGGPCRTLHAPAEPGHEKDVQPEIEADRQGKNAECGVHLPGRTEQGAVEIVDEGCRKGKQDDAQIGAGKAEDIVRCLEKRKHRASSSRAERSRRCREQHTRTQRDEVFLAECLHVFCAVDLGKENGNADAGPDNGEEEQVHHRTGHADSREFLQPRVPRHHEGVDGIIELLKDIACDKGDGKARQMKGDASPGQVAMVLVGGVHGLPAEKVLTP